MGPNEKEAPLKTGPLLSYFVGHSIKGGEIRGLIVHIVF